MESFLSQTNNGNGDGTSSNPLRKRLGRPPKNKQTTQQQDQQPPEQVPQHHQDKQLQQSKLLTPEMIATSLNECRRSSRKKIIKFDVRDLLNKNRNKTHKVQIEARIDSDVRSSNNIYEPHLNNSSTASTAVNDDMIFHVDHTDSKSKQIAVKNLSSNIKSFKDINQFAEESNDIIEDEQQQNLMMQRKRGRPSNMHNMPKRGRGRPPKCRNQDTFVPSVEKISKPRLSSSVSVLVKKLDLAEGQVFKVTGNNCFEKVNITNNLISERHKNNSNLEVASYAQNEKFISQLPDVKKTNVEPTDNEKEQAQADAEVEEVLEDDKAEEEEGVNDQVGLEEQVEEEIIFEISSSSSLPPSSNLNRDDVANFEVLNESSDAEENVNIINISNERGQRNFACVSFMQQQSDLGHDENATTTTISPQFIVAHVEEIISDNNNFIVETEEDDVEEVEIVEDEEKDEENNISIEEIVYDEEEEETTALDDSFIVIMDMNNESSSSAVVTGQHDDEIELVDCDITISSNANDFCMDAQQEVSTIDDCPMEINNELNLQDSSSTKDLSAIAIDENSNTKSENLKETQQIHEILAKTVETINKCESLLEKIIISKDNYNEEEKEEEKEERTKQNLSLECMEIEKSDGVKSNSEENSAENENIINVTCEKSETVDVANNEESRMDVCPDEVNNEVIESANNNKNNMQENIDNATNLINSMVIDNEVDAIEVIEEVEEEEKQNVEKIMNTEEIVKTSQVQNLEAEKNPEQQKNEEIENIVQVQVLVDEETCDQQNNEEIAESIIAQISNVKITKTANAQILETEEESEEKSCEKIGETSDAHTLIVKEKCDQQNNEIEKTSENHILVAEKEPDQPNKEKIDITLDAQILVAEGRCNQQNNEIEHTAPVQILMAEKETEQENNDKLENKTDIQILEVEAKCDQQKQAEISKTTHTQILVTEEKLAQQNKENIGKTSDSQNEEKCDQLKNEIEKPVKAEQENNEQITKADQVQVLEAEQKCDQQNNEKITKNTQAKVLEVEENYEQQKNDKITDTVQCNNKQNNEEIGNISDAQILEDSTLIVEKCINETSENSDSVPEIPHQDTLNGCSETKKINIKETPTAMNEISQAINVETSTLIDILRTVESNKQQINEINQNDAVAMLKDNSNDNEAQKLSPSPATVQKRRAEKRFRYVIETARPKTLEETFAEIAEQSSKVVLEMAAVGNKLEDTGDQHTLNLENSMNNDAIEIENKTINDVVMNCLDNNVQRTISPKRRGRKPKQKNQPPAAVTSEPSDQDKISKISLPAVLVEDVKNVDNSQESIDRKHEEVEKAEEEEIINLLSKNMQINNNDNATNDLKALDFDETKETKLNDAEDLCKAPTATTSSKVLENSDELLLQDSKTLRKQKRKSRWDEQEFRQDSPTIKKLEHELAMKKERHNQLKAAFKAALSEVANNTFMENPQLNLNNDKNLLQNSTTQVTTTTTTTTAATITTLINPNLKLDLTDATLPLMLYKSMTAKLDKEIHNTLANNNKNDKSSNTNNNKASNPLSDIEKFIADGVSLLKKNTAIDAENPTKNTAENIDNSKKILVHEKTEMRMAEEENPLQKEQLQEQVQKHVTNIDEEKLNTAKNISYTDSLCNELNDIDIEKTTTTATPTQRNVVDQEEGELENYNDEEEEEGECEEEEEGGKLVFQTNSKTFAMISTSSKNIENVRYGLELHGDETAALRRSHRIKQITNAPKALVGRGLVRDKERFSLKDDVETKTAYSLDDHLTDLAEVEAKNAKFLKDMEERLSNFQVIKENEYKCEHLVSKEARRMICDCFLTKEEEERGELGCGEDCLNRLLMIECGPNCNVKERCTNKRFQKYLCSPCRVFRTEKKGFGIMADIEILPGEFIMEYVGEVIDGDEFERRRTAYSLEKNRHYYFMALRSDAIIDATTKGNISRFINHSCDPNAETQKWTVNGELRIGFFSRKSIMPGEEITFDYQYQRYGREAQRCYCESSNCRGWIGEEPTSDEGEQNDDASDDDDNDLLEGDEEDDDDDDDSVSDPLEAQKKLEIAAAAAKLVPMSEEERRKKKHAKVEEEEEDSTVKFRKLLNKISEKVAKKKQEQRKASRGRPRKSLKINKSNDGLSPSKGRFLEDPDIEDEVNFLKVNGLKNQSDTLSLSRLMVRAKLPQTRLNLLEVLRQGEEPCRRLFLDYHGLRLLHGWMNENSNNMEIRLALLKTLMRLPITNKTVLKDSKVLQTIHNWCLNHKTLKQAKAHASTNNSTENNSSPSDESSKESTAVGMAGLTEDNVNTTTDAATVEADVNDIEIKVAKLAEKLITSWDNLLEIFRIPKRERLEQMKEHEREADRQYVATLEDDDDAQGKHKLIEKNNGEQQQRNRFGRGIMNRVHNNRPYSNRHNPMTDFKRRTAYDDTDDMRHLSKEKRREIFAARVAREEAEKLMTSERREFEIKCRFFGLNVKRTKPHDIPFCVNTTTGQWYSFDRRPIPTPPNYRHAPMRPKYKSTNPNDYKLPAIVSKLPKNWRYGITPLGKIYYYHVKHRQPQWEPPCTNQVSGEALPKIDTETDAAIESTDDDEHLIKDMDEVQFKVYKEQKVEGRRRKRRNNLITERPISPRRDEDRAYNQQEVRKYKENKEKIRKRKEEIRRRRVEQLKRTLSKAAAIATATTTTTNEDTNMAELNLNEKSENEIQDENATGTTTTKTSSEQEPLDALPIQEYLLSSDEDHAADNVEQIEGTAAAAATGDDDNGNNYDDDDDVVSNALLYKIVEGDKIVDELDALMAANVSLKRPLPPLSDYSIAVQLKQHQQQEQQQHQQQQQQQPQQQQQQQLITSSNRLNSHESVDLTAAVSSSSHNSEKYELHKRRKQEKKDKEKSKRNNSSSNNNSNSNGGSRGKESDSKLRKIREKFRCDIAGIIVHYLKPYRKSNCQRGRIRSDEDYNHLARKLTHFVMIKETKYCESVGQTLVVTESVKNKSKEFIKKYMAKYGEIYEKPNNDPEFKEIPFNIKPTHDRS